MAKLTFERCGKHLADVFGCHYTTTRGDGIDAMSRELQQQFQLTANEADALLREMEQSRLIRYRQGDEVLIAAESDRYREPMAAAGAMFGMDLPGGAPFREPAGMFVAGQGHWVIGED